MATTATPKLYYFDVYALGEPIRLLFTHAKVPFDDVRLNKDSFTELKNNDRLEFGQVPMLEVDGKRYTQSKAILRLLGKQHGYYPTDDAFKAW